VAATRVEELKTVYLIHGKEDLLLERALERLRERVAKVADLDFNSETFDGEVADPADIVAAANTLPFASEKRLVVVRSVEKMDAAGQARLAAYAADPSPTSCLVLVARSLPKNSRLFRAIDAAGGTAEYKPPERGEYGRWVQVLFESQGVSLQREAAEHLIRAIGRDLRRLESEAAKIIAYVGESKRATLDDVTAVVSESAPASVFGMLDALGARECGTVIRLVDDLVGAGESPHALHAMAVRHVRTLLSGRALVDRGEPASQIAVALGLRDWQTRNVISQAKRFTEHELTVAVSAAVRSEAAVKQGLMDGRLALERWLVSVCAPTVG
jgi:DNA polymerase-3 subunit delta